MNKKTKTRVLTLTLAAVCAIPFASAYFTDSDTVDNVFTYGNVEVELDEPNWEEPKTLLPNQTVKKDPTITNTGENPAFVFAEVKVPYANITVASADGTKASEKADTELFTYTVNQGWTELGTGTKNSEDQTVTHVYVYGTASKCSELAKDAKITLYNEVTFVNAIEDEGFEGQKDTLTNSTYVIQTTDINGGTTNPAEVWGILSKQAK